MAVEPRSRLAYRVMAIGAAVKSRIAAIHRTR
jgi:hypothetical protein